MSQTLTLTIMSLVSKTCNKGTDMITHLITDLYLLKLMIKLRIVHVTMIMFTSQSYSTSY